MGKDARQIEYDYILKEAKHKSPKPVDRWFLNYCMQYAALCRRVKEV